MAEAKSHCESHNERCQMHKDLADDVYSVRDEVMAVRATRRTEKYFYGIIGTIIMIGLSVAGWVFNDNLSTIRTKLSAIEGFMISASTNDTAIKGRLDNLEWRMQQLEKK